MEYIIVKTYLFHDNLMIFTQIKARTDGTRLMTVDIQIKFINTFKLCRKVLKLNFTHIILHDN